MMSHSSEPSRVRFVFFDAVGTLIYPDPPAQDVYVAVGQRFGSVLTRAQISRRFKAAFVRQEKNEILSEFERSATNEERERQRWRTIVAEVFDEVDDAQGALFEVLWVHFAQAASWKLFPDVAATWSELELRGIPSGIASNFDERLETIRQSHPPLDRCQVVCWSAEVGWPKPSPFFFRVLEQRVGAAPEELLLAHARTQKAEARKIKRKSV